MKKTLEDNNYIVIRNFISKDKALNLFLEYANYCKNNDVEGDSQCPNCFGTYDCIPFLELLCEKTPVVSFQKEFFLHCAGLFLLLFSY